MTIARPFSSKSSLKRLLRVVSKTDDWSIRLQWYTRTRQVELGLPELVKLSASEAKLLAELQKGIAVFRTANLGHLLNSEPRLKELLYRHVSLAPELNNID